MTREKYKSFHETSSYVGKHEPKWYEVWRVLSAVGPQETIVVYGRAEAEKATEGCWDYEITQLEGSGFT